MGNTLRTGEAKGNQVQEAGDTSREQQRVPEDTPDVQSDNSEDLRRRRKSGLRCECQRCPHHPIVKKDDLKSHENLHKMQQRVKIPCFKDGVRIPGNHPSIAVINHRFM